MAGNTTFQVRLKANADPGSKSAKITVESSGAQSKEVTLTGTVSAVAPVWNTIPTQNTTVEDGVMAEMTDYLSTQGSPAPTITVTSTGANTPTGGYEMDGTGFYFYTVAADAGKTFVFTFTASNAGGSPTATMTVNVAAGEYTWDGTESGWCLKGSAGGLDWYENTTAKKMITDADFGGGDYSRVTLNSLSGAVTYKWYGGGSFWIGKFGDDQATPAFNTVYVAGGGSWGGNFSSTFTSGKYYTFRGKFYPNPSNAGERMNDFVIMETTGAPTEIRSASDNSSTAGTGTVTVTATLDQTLNSEEKLYIRYSTDGWTTSSMVQMTGGSGTSRTGTIPAKANQTTVSYYLLTSTLTTSAMGTNVDLCTLHGLKSGTTNYSYTVKVPPTIGGSGTTALGTTTATVQMTGVNMNGWASTQVKFEYGTTTSYGTTVTPGTTSFTAGTTSGSSSVNLTSLTAGTPYYYRWTVKSSGGTTTKTGSFTTLAPTLSWGSASGVTTLSAKYGSAGAAGSAMLTGSNLSGNVTVAAPSGFQVSKTSATDGFADSVTVSPSSGSVSQQIWVRLTGAAVSASVTGNVGASGGGVSTAVNLSVSGAVTCFDAPDVDDSNTSAMVMDLRWTAVPGATSYKVEVGTDDAFSDPTPGGKSVLAANAATSGTTPNDATWTYSATVSQNNGYPILGYSDATIESPEFSAADVTTLIVSWDNRKYGGPSTAQATTTVTLYDTSTSPATVLDTTTAQPTTTTMTNCTWDISTYAGRTKLKVKWQNESAGSNKGCGVQAFEISGTATGTPGSKVAEGTRTTAGVASGDGTWTVDGSSWQWTWDAEDEGLPEDTYYWRVTATGGTCSEADEGDVELTAVTPTLTVSPLTLALGSTTYGTPGGAQSFSVSGSDLTAGVTVTPPAGVSVCLTSGGEYQTTPLTISQASATSGATVYVKLTGASVGSPSGNISVASTGAETVNVSVSGTVTAVAPTVGSPTSGSVGTTGATLGGTVTANGGAALTGGGVQYRVNGSGAAWTTVAAGSTPTLNTAFTVLVTGLTPGTTYEFQAYAGNGTQTGYTASGVTFTTLRPTLTVSPLTVSDMAGVQYQDGTPVNVSVSGANMMGNVTVAVTSGFEVSTDDGASWGAEKYITVAGATLSATTVKVRIAAGSGTGAVTGTLTVSSSNAADVTVSLSGSVSGATVDTGSWLGKSRLVLNGTWYKGSATAGEDPAVPATLGYLTSLTLGAQVQTYGQNDGETYPAYMTYSIDSGAETTVALIWFQYAENNNWFGMGGTGGQHVQTATTLDLSGLSGGEHTLTVYFSQPTSVGSGTLYDQSSTRVDYSVTFVIPAWSGPNTVYWREQAVDGHFVRQDGDGNHDPWWYQIVAGDPGVGFHNPNMTDHGPNDIIFNNNIQLSMTNDAASTVNSITFTSSSSSSRTIRGSQTLTVNSSITNMGGTMNFRVPLAFGGDVTVTNSSSKSIYFYSAVNGNGHTLTKKGAGVLYIANAVTVGGATVAAGRLALNVGGSLSSDVSLTASSAVLSTYPQYAANVVDYAGVISGTGQVLKQGAGTTTLSGNNTYSGNTSVTNGTLIVGHANALGGGKSDVHVGLGTAKLKVGDGVTRVAAKSLNFIAADSELVTGAGKVVAVTNNAVIKKVSFDAGSYSGDDTQWAIVTSESGTITQSGALTVVNPPATGTCTLELSADNKTLYVTYHKPPAAPSLTVTTVAGNAGQLSGTATPPAGAGVVVVRLTAGSFGEPSGTTLPSVGTTDWAGGTVVSVSSGTFTDSGLTGCTTYSYKAWSLKNGLWSTTGATGSAETATVAAPTGLAEGVVTASSAVLNWTGATGAGGYLLDIAKGASFGGGVGTVVASADFSSFPAGGTVDISGSLGSYGMTGWTGYQIFTLSGYARLGTSKTNGFVTTPDIASLPAGTEISFRVKQFNDKGGELNVFVWDAEAWDEDDESYGMWVTVGDSVALSSATDWKTVTVTTTVAYADTPVSFDTDQTLSEMRCYIDDIVVTTPGSTPTYVTADGKTYNQYDVGDVTSYSVTGLDEDTDYVWRLYSYGATTACKSDASSTDTFSTPPDASLTGVTISDANGADGESAVAAGAVAAGQTVLVQGSKLVVAAGSVNPTLTGVTFTTTGTAGTDDLATFQVRVGTSATFAGTETVKGTVTAGAAGSHTVTFGSAQTLTAGQTYYVWIEAVTKAGATGGNTVGVAALTGASFATTNARKTGSTTATGLQTIGNLTAFEATTGASAGGKVDLTWTVGASGSVLVRWSDVSLAAIPDPGTAWLYEHTEASASSYTVTGLTGCKTYYFKAWEVIDGTACGTAQTDSADASSPAAPTGLGHGTPTAHEATLTWTAGAGAASHVVDLWHFDGASEGGGSGGISGIGGTYEMITSTNDLSDGNYVIVGITSGTCHAMTNTAGSHFIQESAIAAGKVGEGNATLTITDEDAGIVWHLENHDGYWTIKNGDNYVIWPEATGSNNYADLDTDGSATKAHWSISYDGTLGGWEVNNQSTAGNGRTHLRYNNNNTRFACYNSGQIPIQLYKQTSGGGGGGSSGTKVDDIIAGVVQPESSVVVTNGATSVGLGHLTDGTTYYWTVKALGDGGCAGGVSSQDSFTTAMLLGVPTIVSPLTNGVEQLSGSITGAAGATMILKRYESEDAAMAATADGSLGGVVVTTTEGTGAAAGTWTFTDTGLDGCKTYYYRAWQKATVDGELATSSGSNVASGKTDLGTPTVSAVGAGTQLTVNWTAVPGATSYKVQISDTTNVWTATAGGEGTAVLTENFAGFTASDSTDISGSLDTYTTESGWTGTKVYSKDGSAKLGTSSLAGELTTPSLAAMTHGGRVYFDLQQYNSTDGGNLKVEQCIGTSTNWTTLKTFTPSEEWQTGLQADIPAGASAFKLRFETTKKRAYIDNVRVVPLDEVPEGSGQGLIYESTVTSAPWSRTKTGLTIGQTYYYRVIATGGECETEAGGSALTADAPIIEVMPMHYNFGTVTKNEGAVTADFIVRNTGSVALKFSSVALVQDGDAYSITSPASGLTADLAAGESRTYTVTFNPTNSGVREATLRFANDAYNVTGEVPPASGTPTYGNLDIPLTGTCYDPATADPTVYWLKVEDELGIEDTVTDHSMAHEDHEPVLTVLTWHYNRSYRTLDRSAKATQWTLYDPNGDVVVTSGGTRLENQFFTDVEDYVYDGKTCAKFSVPIPALGTGKAVRGTYTVKIKVYDSTGTYCTETKEFLPIERGWLFEDFTRADREATGSGALENGWTAMVSGGAVVGEAAIHADALELYGANGECPGVAGRIAVARDMSDVGYATNPHEFVGTGSWGFHFRTGAKTVGFGDGSTAGAFVLGSTASTWLTATPGQVGYAVAMSNDVVQLVKFENSLLANGTITQLGEEQFSGTQGKLLAVRVDFLPGQDEVDVDESDDGQHHDAVPAKFRLYVKEVASTGGSPIEECTDADLVVEYALPGTEDHDLKFAGMMWNHGVAQVSDKTGAMFDDIYMPHMEGQTEPMMFHVIDEDTEAPTFYDFSILGAYAAQSIWDNGLVVTGYVHDASGIPSGSVTYTVYDGDEVLAGPEPMSVTAVDGSSTEFKLVGTIPGGLIPASIRSTACRFVVTATDGDDDRSEGGTNIDALTGTGSFPFTLCDTAPTAPAWATAEADGAEMVVLRWARTAGTQYIVVRSDEEIGDNASPQGRTETMAEGTTVAGWGTVVYNGTGDNHLTGTWTAREFVVAPGSANYFAVYGMTGNGTTGYYFSAPTKPSDWSWTTGTGSEAVTTYATAACGEGAGRVPAGSPNGMPCMPSVTVRSNSWPVVTAKYEPGEGVDAFAYRTSVSYPTNNIAETPAELALAYGFETRTGTGSGWETNAPTGWQGDTNAWKIHDGSLLAGDTGYPTPTANKLYWQDTSKDWGTKEDMKLTRWLDAPESGDFFVAAILNFQYDGTGKWVTLSMVDEDGNDLVSFGKQGGDTDLSAAIMTPSTSPFGDNTRTNTNNGAAYTLTTGHGNDHIVIGQLSRTENKLRMWCYTGNMKIPEVFSKKTAGGAEVALGVATTAVNTVRADLTFDANLRVPDVAGIRLCAGSDIGVELGHVYFDEVRFAGTWEELLLFNDPEVEDYDLGRPTGSGMSNGTNSLGQTQWLVSDGALAHGNVGLNATFDLYHRTGIDSASFHILSSGASMTNLLRTVTGSTPATEGGTAADVTLTGTKGAVYGEWATPSGGATGVAMPTNWISLESNYVVEVSLRSSGGRESTSTSATDNMGGGATDLFFGEYGEGASWDKYVEIYNGTGRDIDLHNYFIVRPANAKSGTTVVNDFSTSYTNLKLHATAPYARLSSSSFVLHHKQTVVLLNDVNQPGHPDRLAKMKTELDKIRAKYLVMPKEVLDSNGSVPYLLVKAEDFDETAVSNAWKAGNRVTVDWLDACGCADGMGATERYIMSRKPEAKHLPRSNPLLIDTNEWDFRRWSYPVGAVDDSTNMPPYTNFIATAGGYDRAIGLGGTMEFKVYDDDTDAPVLKGGGVSVGGTRRAAETGERVYVMGAWSFTNYLTGAVLTQEDYQRMASMWPMGMTTNGGISWSPLLGDNLSDVLEATSSSGQSGVDFDGLGQVKRGDMLAKASNRFPNEKEVWLGFDLDVAKLSDAVLTFGYAGGPNGFQNGRVEVSTTGLDGSFKMPNEWDFAPQSGTNATTWTEWSRDLADAVAAVPEVATAGHLWFRVVLKNYKSSGGTFRMDNIRLEGAPEAVRVSDAELNTQAVVFDARVLDEASGLDANTATFEYGVSGVTLTPSRSLDEGGKRESTFTWSTTGGFEKAKVQEWYTNSLAGKTQLRVTISDKDDDRPGDALEMTSSYGLLDVYDDDAEPPVLEMETMKPRKEGVFAEWKPKEKTQTPSETMAGLDVSALELFTTAGRTSKPRYAGMGDGETKTYALYANGWQAGSKYWTTTISNSLAGAGTISRISFDGKVGNVLAPTGFRVEYGTVAHGAVAAETTASAGTGSLLTTGDAWSKENDAEAGGSPIKTWKTYELEFATPIPLAAAGEPGDMIELRIFGTGADPDGIGAYWYLYDLKLEGEITLAEDGYTYVTDDSLAGGTTLDLRGSVYDEVSGLLAAPTYSLTNAATGSEISSGTLTLSGTPATLKTKGAGEFSEEITLSSMGYGIQLAEYKGGIHAEDADDDRGTAGEDKLSLDAQFAFTVVDQDLVGPTAPTNVTVNGVAVPQTAPNRNNVTWTNKPEFLVAFDVAHDEVPTAAQLGDADWLAAHGVAASSVKKASIQNVATGVGEYRVALATDAATLSNAPAFSVAATNGALANYGFERQTGDIKTGFGWTLGDGAYACKANYYSSPVPAEGTNSLYVAASDNLTTGLKETYQLLTFPGSEGAVKVGGSFRYYLYGSSAKPRVWISAYTDETCTEGVGTTNVIELWNKGGTVDAWNLFTLPDVNDGSAVSFGGGGNTVGCIKVSLVTLGGRAYFDDMRIGVKVGDGSKGTMRYVADAASQGLNVKYLFAADADNNRPQDRMLGDTATFYTAYDITPPTAVRMPQTGASTETVDDPTTQFDLSWITENVGPDDKDSQNGQAAGLTSNDALSPWYSYKIYYGVRDAMADEVEAATRNLPLDEYLAAKYITSTDTNNYQNWPSVTADSTIEDPNVDDATTYAALGQLETYSIRLYDLDFDQDYMVVIVGVDKAGNEGPATTMSWATNNTIKFAITQGVMRAKSAIIDARPSAASAFGDDDKEAAALYWNAAASADGQIKRTYDLIAMDAGSFSESKNNTWNLIGDSVRTNWSFDTGALRRNGNYIRFYRAAYQDRWRPSYTNDGQVITQRPMVSEDVYAMTAVKLIEGQNYVSLHGYGYTNTIGGIFGTDPSIWPTSSTKGQCTKLEFFPSGFKGAAAGTNAISPSRTFYLSSEGKWRDFDNISVEVTDNIYPELFQNGVSITLPAGDNFPANKADFTVTNGDKTLKGLYWHPILRVPTNNLVNVGAASDDPITIEVKGGSSRTGSTWNFLALNLPVSASPYRLGLELGTPHGFSYTSESTSPGKLTSANDILYAYDPVNRRIRHETGMYLTRGGSYTNHYHWTEIDPTTHQPVEMSTNVVVTNAFIWRSIYDGRMIGTGETPFQPNDMLVIDSRGNLQDWVWEYYPSDFYDFPTRWSGW